MTKFTGKNSIKLMSLSFKSWEEIRYYNEFMKACREGEQQAKESFVLHDENTGIETFLILN